MIHLKKILLEQTVEDVEKKQKEMDSEQQENADNAFKESLQEVLEEDSSLVWLLQTGAAIVATTVAGFIIFKLFKGVKRVWSGVKSVTASANKLWKGGQGLFSERLSWLNNKKTRQEGIKKVLLEPIKRAKNKVKPGTKEHEYLATLGVEVEKALNKPSVMLQLERVIMNEASKELFRAFKQLKTIKPSQKYTATQIAKQLAPTKVLLAQIKKAAGEPFNKDWAETMLLGKNNKSGIYSKTESKWPYNYERVVQPAVRKMIDDVYNVTTKPPMKATPGTKATNPIEKGLEQQSRLILPGMPGYSSNISNIRTSGN